MLEKEPESWRELLARITHDQAGMQRIVQELGVRDITVRRWIKGESEPRPQNLRRLLGAVPEHRERFLEFFANDFEDFSDLPLDESYQEIPNKFYAHIFQLRGTISRSQRYWLLANTIISQALTQLDPENLGMAITVIRCMKVSNRKKIFSLRQSVGQGTTPWPGNLEQQAMFLGAESLAGYALENCRPAEVQNYKEDTSSLLSHQFELEQSAIAHPILCAGRVAGCLLLSSTQPLYFVLPLRQSLISDYAHLMSLAFDADDFVDPSLIELRIMPPHKEQKLYFENFRQRLINARIRLYEEKSDTDAEQCVWEEIERDILKLSVPQVQIS
ncbi:MAG TPA: hypothetical protein VFN35_07060 [Ktedonobacteraceae bacterium]|nr:hypothetical protein [Ktedonobacteraceae bacterium]